MITLEHVYIMTGIMFAAFAIGRALDRSSARRWRSAAFWGTYALSFLAGSHLPRQTPLHPLPSAGRLRKATAIACSCRL